MLLHVHGSCDSEDDKVSLDDLQEKVQEFEDYVQSTDIAAMQSKSQYTKFTGWVN